MDREFLGQSAALMFTGSAVPVEWSGQLREGREDQQTQHCVMYVRMGGLLRILGKYITKSHGFFSECFLGEMEGIAWTPLHYTVLGNTVHTAKGNRVKESVV